jgi:hypothetical protein
MSHVYVTRSEQRKAAANTDEEWTLYERALIVWVELWDQYRTGFPPGEHVRVSPCSDPLSVFCAKPSERSASR